MLLFVAFAVTSQQASQVEFSIRFFDRTIYFTESTVQVKLEFYNNSASPARFKIANLRFFSFEFDVRSMSNVAAELAPRFLIARGDDSPVFFRELTLQPGERFGFVTDLNQYVQIPPPGIHAVRAYFYPELYGANSVERIVSNVLTLTVHPGSTERAQEVALELETGEMLARAALPPDEVITAMLQSRQREAWESFFLYIDLESLYTRATDQAERYARLSDEERRTAIAMYRDRLADRTTEDDILVVPTSFEIERTAYTASEATVVAIERFQYPGFTEIKEYTYYLRRRDRLWMIYDYGVRNLGTE